MLDLGKNSFDSVFQYSQGFVGKFDRFKELSAISKL